LLARFALKSSEQICVPNKSYNLQSWIDPRIEIRASPIGGRGMFAREPIKAGETVIVWGGVVLTKEDLQIGNYREATVSAIADNLWLGDAPSGEDFAADYTNHPCDPNLWMKDGNTLAARRDIAVGEELTADYMMWEANEDYRAA
jgi:SET domain-containing protein